MITSNGKIVSGMDRPIRHIVPTGDGTVLSTTFPRIWTLHSEGVAEVIERLGSDVHRDEGVVPGIDMISGDIEDADGTTTVVLAVNPMTGSGAVVKWCKYGEGR